MHTSRWDSNCCVTLVLCHVEALSSECGVSHSDTTWVTTRLRPWELAATKYYTAEGSHRVMRTNCYDPLYSVDTLIVVGDQVHLRHWRANEGRGSKQASLASQDVEQRLVQSCKCFEGVCNPVCIRRITDGSSALECLDEGIGNVQNIS